MPQPSKKAKASSVRRGQQIVAVGEFSSISRILRMSQLCWKLTVKKGAFKWSFCRNFTVNSASLSNAGVMLNGCIVCTPQRRKRVRWKQTCTKRLMLSQSSACGGKQPPKFITQWWGRWFELMWQICEPVTKVHRCLSQRLEWQTRSMWPSCPPW